MILYIARCKNKMEAGNLENQFVRLCPTLINTRTLERTSDLDLYNSEMLWSDGLRLSCGTMTFGKGKQQATKRALFLWIGTMSLACVFSAAALYAIFELRLLDARHSPLATSLVLLSVVVLAVIGYLSVQKGWLFKKEHRAFIAAEAWLKKGLPVVIAASEDLPNDDTNIPNNIIYFDRITRTKRKRA